MMKQLVAVQIQIDYKFEQSNRGIIESESGPEKFRVADWADIISVKYQTTRWFAR